MSVSPPTDSRRTLVPYRLMTPSRAPNSSLMKRWAFKSARSALRRTATFIRLLVRATLKGEEKRVGGFGGVHQDSASEIRFMRGRGTGGREATAPRQDPSVR